RVWLMVWIVMHCDFQSRATRSFDLKDAHHALILMIENVAMKHPFASKIIESDDETCTAKCGEIHRVLPHGLRLRHAVSVEDLKLEAVQVEWMIHSDEVLNLPDFGGAQGGLLIDAAHVHRLPVDPALLQQDRARRVGVRDR